MKPLQLSIYEVRSPADGVSLRLIHAMAGDRSASDVKEWAGVVVCDKPEADLRAATLKLAAETLEKALA